MQQYSIRKGKMNEVGDIFFSQLYDKYRSGNSGSGSNTNIVG